MGLPLNQLPPAWLPNQDGFRFVARMKDGSERAGKVFKGEHGLYGVTDMPYEDIVSWRYLNNEEEFLLQRKL